MIERGDNKGGDNITVWMCLVVAHSFTVVVFGYISLFVHLSLSLSLALCISGLVVELLCCRGFRGFRVDGDCWLCCVLVFCDFLF